VLVSLILGTEQNECGFGRRMLKVEVCDLLNNTLYKNGKTKCLDYKEFHTMYNI